MALHINDRKVDKLVRKLARKKGETLTEAIGKATEERLARAEEEDDKEKRLARIYAILEEIDKLPVLDNRSADEIIGYDENGLFD